MVATVSATHGADADFHSGGAELLANNVRVHKVEVPQGLWCARARLIRSGNMRTLIAWVRDNIISERKELFVQGEGVYVHVSVRGLLTQAPRHSRVGQ